VRVAKNAKEEALVERLAVASQKLARLAANGARGNRRILARRELVDRTLEQRERLVTREPLSDHLGLGGRSCGGYVRCRRCAHRRFERW
jgi:hypothetical protein